jgi:hypothetical protein
MLMPTSLAKHDYGIYRSHGFVSLPGSVPPCTNELERDLLDALIQDLNTVFMCNLATEFGTDREPQIRVEDDGISSNTRYVFVVRAMPADWPVH